MLLLFVHLISAICFGFSFKNFSYFKFTKILSKTLNFFRFYQLSVEIIK